jgi:hypothetical protein
MGVRNRVGIGLSYRPARLHMLAELISWNQFLGSLKVKKFGFLRGAVQFSTDDIKFWLLSWLFILLWYSQYKERKRKSLDDSKSTKKSLKGQRSYKHSLIWAICLKPWPTVTVHILTCYEPWQNRVPRALRISGIFFNESEDLHIFVNCRVVHLLQYIDEHKMGHSWDTVPNPLLNPHQNDQGRKGPCCFQRLIALKCLKCQKIKKKYIFLVF